MYTKLKIFFFLIFVLTAANNIYAQETMFRDLSYPYLEKLITTAKANYPAVKAKKEQVNIARSSFHQSGFGWLEAFSGSYIYSPQSAINATQPVIFKGYQIVGTLNLGSLFERPYTIHNARLAVKVAELEQQQYDLTLEAQVKRAYFSYLSAQADLRGRVNAVQDASTAAGQLKHTFEKGETTFQVYSEALTNLYNQNSFRVKAELAVFTAKTDLEELLGAKLESIK